MFGGVACTGKGEEGEHGGKEKKRGGRGEASFFSSGAVHA